MKVKEEEEEKEEEEMKQKKPHTVAHTNNLRVKISTPLG